VVSGSSRSLKLPTSKVTVPNPSESKVSPTNVILSGASAIADCGAKIARARRQEINFIKKLFF
jgi:hypothetical protein